MMRRRLGAAIVGAALATGCVFGKAQDVQKTPATAKAVEKPDGVLYETKVSVSYCWEKNRKFSCRDVLENEVETKERPALKHAIRSLPSLENCIDGPHGPESLYIRGVVIERGYTIDDDGTINRFATGDTIESYEFNHPHDYCIKQAQPEKKPDPNDQKTAEATNENRFEQTR